MRHSLDKAWVVVAVESGIPVAVKGFRYEERACVLARKLSKEANPQDDEVAIFEIHIPHSKRSRDGARHQRKGA